MGLLKKKSKINKDDIVGPDYIKEAIQFIKDCPLKGTAFKVELEANLYRRDGQIACISCRGRGYRFCRDCSDGFIDGTRKITCTKCKGWFRIPCKPCSQQGRIATKIMSDDECSEFMLSHVSREAREALIFHLFYPDGSVGSEFTFTLPLNKAAYAVEFIQAFKELAEHIGAGMDTDGAGMHLAILNSSAGQYPEGNSLELTHRAHFERAMRHFLPALYFLGSTSFKSRGLNFRYPRISDTKFSAINYGQSIFEYRFFETCYERPEAVLDDLCVIAKTLEYYTDNPKWPAFFNKIGHLGMRDGLGVHRFFYTEKHLKALDAGLEYIKPDHKTITQLKRERNFTVTADRLKRNDMKFDVKTEQEWRSYKLRTSREKDALQKKLRSAYQKQVKIHGRGYVENEWGTLAAYIRNRLPKNESLKRYVDTKKHERLTKDIITNIEV